MIWAQVALAILTDFPELIAVLQKWRDLGTTPKVEDLQAELAQLGIDDDALVAAYERAFPGQTPPK